MLTFGPPIRRTATSIAADMFCVTDLVSRQWDGVTVRAVVCDRYGPPDLLRLEDVERPLPATDEVLVKIRATTVNRTDCGFRSGKPFIGRIVTGLRGPKWKILGSEVAGEVEGVGAAITEFKVGDQVFGVNPWRFGAHAEYVCIRESARWRTNRSA
jgi:NADPH:quinone reductase-like Zn-dependent oxidoreductase